MTDRHTQLASFGEAESRIWLNGPENVILQLRPSYVESFSDDRTITWGFATVEDWRTFLKSCLRFDEAIGTH